MSLINFSASDMHGSISFLTPRSLHFNLKSDSDDSANTNAWVKLVKIKFEEMNVLHEIGARQLLSDSVAYVFDYYGTLVKYAPEVLPMWRVINELGYRSSLALELAFEADSFDGYLTPTLEAFPNHAAWIRGNLTRFLSLSGVPAHAMNEALTSLRENESKFTPIPVPFAKLLLDSLRCAGKKIALCSNWEQDITQSLAATDLPIFDAISFSAAVGARKPHELIFADVCQKLGVLPSQVVFVGDNWRSDVVGALRAGFQPIWIRHFRQSQGIYHLVAEFDTLEELYSYLFEA